GHELVHYLGTRADSRSIAALAALTTLGMSDSVRQAAARTLRAVTRDGTGPPGWYGRGIELTECWRGGDVFGETTTVVCVAEGGVTRHGIVVGVDDDCPPAGPVLSDAFVTVVPDEMIATLSRPRIPGDLAAAPQLLSPRHAAVILSKGLIELDDGAPERDPESALLRLRALLAARCRAVTGGDLVAAAPLPATVVDVNRTLNAFLSSPHSAPLPRTEEVVAAIELIAEFHLPGGLRVGPTVTRTFLHECVPAKLDCDSPVLPLLIDVLRAFNRWAADRVGLDGEAIAVLDTVTRRCAAGFRDRFDEQDRPVPPDWPGLFG
ncbi:MAG: hypothetical protein ACRD0P_37990, partial [Stackebrandtia sp.]